MRRHPPLTSRRAALGVVLGVPLLAACDVDDLRPPEATPSDRTSADPTLAAPPSDPDDALVTQAVEQVELAAATVLATTGPARRAVRPLRRLHAEHLARLAPDRSPGSASPPPAGGAGGVRAAETRLQRELARLAGEVASGGLAATLASMAAAVGQRLAVLPPEVR
ncbi:hypothetical protein [Nocardioides sp. SYSU D00038]|uniref:hypothetical protein n=1 Tax=Nocardioides sp. SYSU D00038 TaxID=2812554 RepID=UPI0019673D24|nr:hypothetical protein [Nocardioides sp. SYSU D00038]